MSRMLPGELAWVLDLLGFNWPQADEDRLMEAAQHWKDFASELGHIRQDAERVAAQVGAENRGAAVEAFGQDWRVGGGRGRQLTQAGQAAGRVAAGLRG